MEKELNWVSDVLEDLRAMDGVCEEKIEEVIKVFEHGASKHRGFQPIDEQLAHAQVHWMDEAYAKDEEESGLPHTAHIAARCLLAFGLAVGLIEAKS